MSPGSSYLFRIDPPKPPKLFVAPNVLVVTRANKPSIPGLDDDEDKGESTRVEPRAPKPTPEELPTGKKQNIVGISGKTKMAIAKLLSTIKWEHHGACVHVTLTYWMSYPETKEELAREKSAISMAVGRLGYCGIWRLEFQNRILAGHVAHWHLLLWTGTETTESVTAKLATWWHRHSANPTQYAIKVTPGKEGRASWYLATHAAKSTQSPPIEVGRWWGYILRDKFLEAQECEQHGPALSEKEMVWFGRLYRRKTGAKARFQKQEMQGFSWFLSKAGQFKALEWIRTCAPWRSYAV